MAPPEFVTSARWSPPCSSRSAAVSMRRWTSSHVRGCRPMLPMRTAAFEAVPTWTPRRLLDHQNRPNTTSCVVRCAALHLRCWQAAMASRATSASVKGRRPRSSGPAEEAWKEPRAESRAAKSSRRDLETHTVARSFAEKQQDVEDVWGTEQLRRHAWIPMRKTGT